MLFLIILGWLYWLIFFFKRFIWVISQIQCDTRTVKQPLLNSYTKTMVFENGSYLLLVLCCSRFDLLVNIRPSLRNNPKCFHLIILLRSFSRNNHIKSHTSAPCSYSQGHQINNYLIFFKYYPLHPTIYLYRNKLGFSI